MLRAYLLQTRVLPTIKCLRSAAYERKKEAYLKEESTMSLKPNTFSVGQRQQSVVVHNGVHVLNPQSIHVAVEDQVLALVLVGRLVDVAENARQKAVGPVPCVWIQNAVKLHHAAILRVDGVQFCCQTQPSALVNRSIDFSYFLNLK